MHRFNLLPWLFAALLCVWGTVMYELRGQLQEELLQLRQQTDSLRQQADSYTLEQAETVRLQRLSETRLEELQALQQQVMDLRTELGFYRQIMDPERTAGGLVVEQLQLEPMLSPNHYRMKLVLIQQASRRVKLGGRINVEVTGSSQQQPARLKLPQVAMSGTKRLNFSFRYFQILEEELLLPSGFKPESIEMKVFVDTPPSAKVARQLRFDWQALVAEGD